MKSVSELSHWRAGRLGHLTTASHPHCSRVAFRALASPEALELQKALGNSQPLPQLPEHFLRTLFPSWGRLSCAEVGCMPEADSLGWSKSRIGTTGYRVGEASTASATCRLNVIFILQKRKTFTYMPVFIPSSGLQERTIYIVLSSWNLLSNSLERLNY